MTEPITVFTPTFNRAFCLGQLYQSLVRQTDQHFLWLIIDDGSTDNTKTLVESWINENRIAIKYVFQQNQGMHSGHNTAYSMIDTELNVCIDSDDYMPDDAIDKILKRWSSGRNEKYAGIIGLDAFTDGSIVGTPIPEDLRTATLSEIYDMHHVTGDKKLVLRTDVVREFPQYPIYPEERLVPLGTLYKMIDRKYTYLCSNDVYCIVEYLSDGSSNNILKQYRKSPKGFIYARLAELQHSKGPMHAFSRAMHLISSALFAGKPDIFTNNSQKFITVLAIPFGLMLHCYILIKTRK